MVSNWEDGLGPLSKTYNKLGLFSRTSGDNDKVLMGNMIDLA